MPESDSDEMEQQGNLKPESLGLGPGGLCGMARIRVEELENRAGGPGLDYH